MIFTTKIAGIPCRCEVTRHAPASPMRITGTGFGDAEPPEPEEIEYQILDQRGRPAPWLAKKLTKVDNPRLIEEFKAAAFANKYGVDF